MTNCLAALITGGLHPDGVSRGLLDHRSRRLRDDGPRVGRGRLRRTLPPPRRTTVILDVGPPTRSRSTPPSCWRGQPPPSSAHLPSPRGGTEGGGLARVVCQSTATRPLRSISPGAAAPDGPSPAEGRLGSSARPRPGLREVVSPHLPSSRGGKMESGLRHRRQWRSRITATGRAKRSIPSCVSARVRALGPGRTFGPSHSAASWCPPGGSRRASRRRCRTPLDRWAGSLG